MAGPSGVPDDAGLLRTSRHIEALRTGKELARLHAAVEEALFLLSAGANVNQPGFDALVSAGLISRSERTSAIPARPPRRRRVACRRRRRHGTEAGAIPFSS